MAKTKITTPVPGFTGAGPGGLKFDNGAAEKVDDASRGPLALSDPASADIGEAVAKTVPDDATATADAAAPPKPKPGDSAAKWKAYAAGIAPDKADEIDGMTKAQIIKTYGA